MVAVTGVLQWLRIYPLVADKALYLFCFALKMAGAVGLFGITFLLALPDGRRGRMQQRRAFWSGINLLCGMAILVGAALMRSVSRTGQ